MSGVSNRALSREDAEEFNRYQRAHQNHGENLPTFYALLLFAGLGYPAPTAVAGLVWIVSRHLYAIGYYRSVKSRAWGAGHYFAWLALISLCLAFAIQLLRNKAPY
jgi:glutathione S-transferase